jgi:O-antigen/teichoic acid export membrane protein
VRQVAFPVFSRIEADRERLLRAYTSANRMASVTASPCFLLALAVAPELVPVVFGDKWSASVPVMQILCLFGMLQAVTQLNGALLSGIGRIRFVFRLGLVNTAVQIVAFAVAVPFGIRWVAASYVIRAYLLAPVGFVVAARELNTTAAKTLSGFIPGLVSGGVMVGSVVAARSLIGDALPESLRLVALVTIAIPVYLLTLRLIGGALFEELMDYVRRTLGGRSASKAAPVGA